MLFLVIKHYQFDLLPEYVYYLAKHQTKWYFIFKKIHTSMFGFVLFCCIFLLASMI